MFGVVVCPRCRRAKGIELPKKTTTCPCGNEFFISSVRVKLQSDDAREIAEAVGRLNAELRGGTEELARATAKPKRRDRDAYLRIVATATRAGDRRHRVRAAAEGLTQEFVLFTADDWRRVLDLLGIPEAESSLDELVRGNVIYEPKPGYFRAV